jgi:phosphoribosyl 1,2-cyclic phosphodiesterase
VRYGGNTSCVALAHDGEDPSLLLDAGTGLRRVTDLLDDRPFEGAILLTHLHPDHIQGLPFFAAADKGRVDLRLPAGERASATLTSSFGAPLFPLRFDELRGDWTMTELDEGEHAIDRWEILALEIPHGGGRTFGYRITDGTGVLAYVTDHCPTALGPGPDGLGEYHDNALRLADHADLLVHDAHVTAAELPDRAFLGHAAVEYAVALAERARARQVALFHHDPDRRDDAIDAIVGTLASSITRVFAAAERETIDVAAAVTSIG